MTTEMLDLTPSWRALILPMCAVLRDPKSRAESIANIETELTRLATFTDQRMDRERRATKYLIWAKDHDAWWAPKREGYTRLQSAAGRYSGADVADILVSDLLNEQRVCEDRPDSAVHMAARLFRERAK